MNILPLLSIEGVTTASWGIDLLHSWHLGPEASYVGHVLYFLLRIGIYTRDSPAFLADEDLMAIRLNQLKADVWRYYRKRQRDDSSGDWKRRGSTIWNLNLKMLGRIDKPILQAKAAETHGLIVCAVSLLHRYHRGIASLGPMVVLDGRLLREAGAAAQRFNTTMANAGRTVS